MLQRKRRRRAQLYSTLLTPTQSGVLPYVFYPLISALNSVALTQMPISQTYCVYNIVRHVISYLLYCTFWQSNSLWLFPTPRFQLNIWFVQNYNNGIYIPRRRFARKQSPTSRARDITEKIVRLRYLTRYSPFQR